MSTSTSTISTSSSYSYVDYASDRSIGAPITTGATAAVRTNLGPLTTQYSAPTTCLMPLGPDYSQASGDMSYYQQCINSTVSANIACWPPMTTTVSKLNADWGAYMYSPGISCPAGFATACVSTAGDGYGFGFVFTPQASETAAGCCPTGFTCLSAMNQLNTVATAQMCSRLVAGIASQSVVAATCDFEADTAVTSAYPSFAWSSTFTEMVGAVSSTSSLVTSTVSGYSNLYMYAPMIQLIWQSSDMPTSTAAVSAATTGAGGDSTDSTSGTTSPGGGLSVGAKVGIGLGIAAVCLVGLIAVIWYLFRRRRKERTDEVDKSEAPSDGTWDGYNKVELPITAAQQRHELQDGRQPPELHDQHTYELHDERQPPELHDQHTYELHDDHRPNELQSQHKYELQDPNWPPELSSSESALGRHYRHPPEGYRGRPVELEGHEQWES